MERNSRRRKWAAVYNHTACSELSARKTGLPRAQAGQGLRTSSRIRSGKSPWELIPAPGLPFQPGTPPATAQHESSVCIQVT